MMGGFLAEGVRRHVWPSGLSWGAGPGTSLLGVASWAKLYAAAVCVVSSILACIVEPLLY